MNVWNVIALPRGLDDRLLVLCIASAAVWSFAAKLSSARRSPTVAVPWWFWLTPLYAVTSWRRSAPVSWTTLRLPLLRSAIAPALLIVWIRILQRSVVDSVAPSWMLSCLAAPLLYLVGEAAGGVSQLAFAPFGGVIEAHHEWPLAARSLREFWGSRWNTHVSDWLRQNVFTPLRRRPRIAGAAAFAVSGMWHELLVNVPYYALTGRCLFGTMVGYFVVQAAGAAVEAKWFTSRSRAARLWLWLVVLAPVPLFVNDAVLHLCHLRSN